MAVPPTSSAGRSTMTLPPMSAIATATTAQYRRVACMVRAREVL